MNRKLLSLLMAFVLVIANVPMVFADPVTELDNATQLVTELENGELNRAKLGEAEEAVWNIDDPEHTHQAQITNLLIRINLIRDAISSIYILFETYVNSNPEGHITLLVNEITNFPYTGELKDSYIDKLDTILKYEELKSDFNQQGLNDFEDMVYVLRNSPEILGADPTLLYLEQALNQMLGLVGMVEDAIIEFNTTKTQEDYDIAQGLISAFPYPGDYKDTKLALITSLASEITPPEEPPIGADPRIAPLETLIESFNNDGLTWEALHQAQAGILELDGVEWEDRDYFVTSVEYITTRTNELQWIKSYRFPDNTPSVTGSMISDAQQPITELPQGPIKTELTVKLEQIILDADRFIQEGLRVDIMIENMSQFKLDNFNLTMELLDEYKEDLQAMTFGTVLPRYIEALDLISEYVVKAQDIRAMVNSIAYDGDNTATIEDIELALAEIQESGYKTSLMEFYNARLTAIATEKKVEVAELSKTQEDFDMAQTAVNALADATLKGLLQQRLDNIVIAGEPGEEPPITTPSSITFSLSGNSASNKDNKLTITQLKNQNEESILDILKANYGDVIVTLKLKNSTDSHTLGGFFTEDGKLEFVRWDKVQDKEFPLTKDEEGVYLVSIEYGGVESNWIEVTITYTDQTPTEPKPTEPKPTEPKPTEPKPTEPEPTPTDPTPTEPTPTEPKPTEPTPTEPKPTEPTTPPTSGGGGTTNPPRDTTPRVDRLPSSTVTRVIRNIERQIDTVDRLNPTREQQRELDNLFRDLERVDTRREFIKVFSEIQILVTEVRTNRERNVKETNADRFMSNMFKNIIRLAR